MGDLTIKQKKEVAQGAKAFGSIAQRYTGNFSKWVLTPFSGLTTLGKVLAGLSAAVILVGGALILFDASHFDLESDQSAVITGKTVNIRSQPTTRSKVQARVNAGYRFTVTGSEGKWKRVQTTDGKLEGWVADSLLDMNPGKTFVYRYDMKGYFLAVIIAMIVLFAASRLKEGKAGSSQSRFPSPPRDDTFES